MKKDHLEVLLEDIDAKLDGLSESISVLPTRSEFNELRDEVLEIKAALDTVRAATVAHGQDLRLHEARLSDPEGAASS